MPNKKLFTFDDLYSFFLKQNKNINFNSKESDTEIVVQVLGSLSFENKNVYEGLAPVHLQACHTDRNRNGSSISAKVMKKAFPTFKNKPILAYIHKIENEDGEMEEVFGWHAMHEDEDGNTIYDERMVGIIPESSSPTLEYDEVKQKYYVNIDGFIYEEYSHAKDILERMGEASVSIEINVTQLSYDAKEKLLLIEDFYLNGVTILGKDPNGNDVEAGMEGSNIKLTDFSREHNSMFSLNNDLLDAINKLNNTLASFNIESLEKGGESQMNKFEELLAKYGKTADDIDFDYESMSDEELETKFEELFGESSGEDNTPSTEDDSENFEDNQENESEDNNQEDDNQEDDSDDNQEENDNENVEDTQEYSIEYSVNNMNFKTSLNDIQYALTTLVNDTYSESDGTYYSCIVYDDCVVMVDYWTGTAYRQSYKVRKGVYSLTGDRVAVRAVYLTADEEAEVDKMKTNYSLYEKELNEYHNTEAKVEKQTIITKPEFSLLAGNSEDYDNLVNEINDDKLHLNYTIEDVQKKCDEYLLAYVKAGNQINFEKDNTTETTQTHLFRLPNQSTKKPKGRYGNLFNKK
jgi:hypothetical protein